MRLAVREIGSRCPVYIVAEVSANHGQDLDQAIEIVKAASNAGADAVKLQTYTPDTMTLNVNNEYFAIKGTVWEGRRLYELYEEAHTPWEWHPKLKEVAESLDLDFFSTPFDETAVDFLHNGKIKIPGFQPRCKRTMQTSNFGQLLIRNIFWKPFSEELLTA